MQYKPKSRGELDRSTGLIPAETFDVECVSAVEKQSKKGNDMMELKLKVYVDESVRFYTDYIMPSNDMGLDKLYTLCASINKLDAYERGVEAEDLEGFTCRAMFAQKKDKESGEMRNELRGYVGGDVVPATEARPVASRGPLATSTASKSTDLESDDIPF